MNVQRPHLVVTGLFLSVLPLLVQAGVATATVHGVLGVGYEVWNLPGRERLGVTELSARFGQGRNAYAGLSVFAAVAGRRGGFFTGGFNAGIVRPVARTMAIDAGVFVGGGGGGAAPQGSGLMTRVHSGLIFQRDNWDWGLYWSRTRFPDGEIDSSQWSVALHRPLAFSIAPGWLQRDDDVSWPAGGAPYFRRRLAINNFHYFPRSGSRDTGGGILSQPLHLLGFSVDFERQSRARWIRYCGVQAAGAFAGDADGYAELFARCSLIYDWHDPWKMSLRLGVGAGGGGRVATGGGLLGRAELAIHYSVNRAIQAALGIGSVTAATGDFNADVLSLHLAYQYDAPGNAAIALPSTFDVQHWRFSIINERYRSAGRVNAASSGLDLIGSRIDWLLDEHVFLSGTAAAAYAGGAGGYASGQFGLGWTQSLFRRIHGDAEVLVGAGGGGGVDVGGGLLLQYQLALEWLIDPRAYYGLRASIGHTSAADGALDTTIMGLGLTWRLSSPIHRLDRQPVSR